MYLTRIAAQQLRKRFSSYSFLPAEDFETSQPEVVIGDPPWNIFAEARNELIAVYQKRLKRDPTYLETLTVFLQVFLPTQEGASWEQVRSQVNEYVRHTMEADTDAPIRSTKVAGAADGKKTGDRTGVGFFIPLAEDLAAQYPSLGDEDKSSPHITFLYVGDVPKEKEEKLLSVARRVLSELEAPIRGTISGLEHFTHPDKDRSIAVTTWRFSRDLSAIRWKLLDALNDAGFDVQDNFPLIYRPHTTLAYMDGADSKWDKPVPSGGFNFDSVEIWGLPTVHSIPVGNSVVVKAGKVAAKYLYRGPGEADAAWKRIERDLKGFNKWHKNLKAWAKKPEDITLRETALRSTVMNPLIGLGPLRLWAEANNINTQTADLDWRDIRGALEYTGPKETPSARAMFLKDASDSADAFSKSVNKILDQVGPKRLKYKGFNIENPDRIADTSLKKFLSSVDHLVALFKGRGVYPALQDSVDTILFRNLVKGEGASGWYNSQDRTVTFIASALDSFTVGRILSVWSDEVLLHEIGHHVYYHMISHEAQDFWDSGWVPVHEAEHQVKGVTHAERKKFWALLVKAKGNLRAIKLNPIDRMKFHAWLYEPLLGTALVTPKQVRWTKEADGFRKFLADPEASFSHYPEEEIPHRVKEQWRLFEEKMGVESGYASITHPMFSKKELEEYKKADPRLEKALDALATPTDYANTNETEDFAETFVAFMAAPGKLSDMAKYRMQRTMSLSGLYGKPIMRLARPKQAVAPRGSDKSKVYYHGTNSLVAAKGILRTGIDPQEIKNPRSLMAPVKGSVYLTPSLPYGVIYALGGDFAGHAPPESWLKGKDPYGYLFVVPGKELHEDIQPDEDFIGELLHQALNAADKSPYAFKVSPLWSARLKSLPVPLNGIALQILTERQIRKVKEGEYSYFASAGKKLLKHLKKVRWGDHFLDVILDMDPAVAHQGSVKPSEAWRIDKRRAKELKPDGSNFFRVAERWNGKTGRTVEAMTNQASVALMKFLSEVATAKGVGRHVYVVGGAVRNFIIDQPIKDLDIVIDSVALGGKDSDWFAKKLAKAIPVDTSLVTNNYGVAIVTIKGDWEVGGVNLKGEDIEIANARKESYGGDEGKGYKPHMVEPATIDEDILRREFTFNTLMWRLMDLANGPDKAEIIDLTGCGLKDLKEGVAKCPRDPDIVFSDDPSRMVRAIKFLLKYGLKLSPDVVKSIKKNRKKLKNIPVNHLANMIIGVFYEGGIGKKALLEMKKLGLLDVVKEIAQEDKSFRSALGHWADRKADLQFVFDLMDLGMPTGRRLSGFKDGERKRIRDITVQMTPAESDAFVAILENPGKVIDMRSLITEFGLKGKEVRQITDIAQAAILDNPVMAANGRRLEDTIRRKLGGRGHTAAKARLSQASSVPIYSALPYLSRTVHRGVDKECDDVQDLIASLKKGGAGSARLCAKALARHPKLRGFKGAVVPAPRSSSEHTPLTLFAEALVREGIGTHVSLAIVREAPVESSRLRRHRGLPGVDEATQEKSMGIRDGVDPDEPILIVDDIVTTGTTIKAAAAVLRKAGHRGPILGGAAGYYEPDAGKADECPVHYTKKGKTFELNVGDPVLMGKYKNSLQLESCSGTFPSWDDHEKTVVGALWKGATIPTRPKVSAPSTTSSTGEVSNPDPSRICPRHSPALTPGAGKSPQCEDIAAHTTICSAAQVPWRGFAGVVERVALRAVLSTTMQRGTASGITTCGSGKVILKPQSEPSRARDTSMLMGTESSTVKATRSSNTATSCSSISGGSSNVPRQSTTSTGTDSITGLTTLNSGCGTTPGVSGCLTKFGGHGNCSKNTGTFTRKGKRFEINVGDPVLFGKYKNSPGRVEGFGETEKGDPTLIVRKKPKGEGQGAKKEVQIFKVRYDETTADKDKASKTASSGLQGLRSKIDMVRDLGGSSIWFVVANKPPTVRDASVLGVPLVTAQTFRDEGGLLFVSDAKDAQRANRFRDGLRGLIAVLWVTDSGLVEDHMADAFSHHSGVVRLSSKTASHKIIFGTDGEDIEASVSTESLPLLFTQQFSDAVLASGEKETFVDLMVSDMLSGAGRVASETSLGKPEKWEVDEPSRPVDKAHSPKYPQDDYARKYEHRDEKLARQVAAAYVALTLNDSKGEEIGTYTIPEDSIPLLMDGKPTHRTAKTKVAGDYYDWRPGIKIPEVENRWRESWGKIYDHSMPAYYSAKELWPYREYTWTREKARGGLLRMKGEDVFLKGPLKWDALVESLKADGWHPDDPLHLMIGREGGIKIGEGNHRLAIARQIGLTKIPVWIHFYSGKVTIRPEHEPKVVPVTPKVVKKMLDRPSKPRSPETERQVNELMDLLMSRRASRAALEERVAAKFQKKKEVPKAKGEGTTTVYEYSDRQISRRNNDKAKRVEKLRQNLHKLHTKLKEDLNSEDDKTRMTALAVGLINDTYERVGNAGSAKEGHFGVTGWQAKHVTVSGGTATFKYVGKSGVSQEKTTKDKSLVRVLKEALKGKSGSDPIFDGVGSSEVNSYLKPLDITAKDIRGLHANRQVQEHLKAVRSKGGKLPTDKKEREKKLKDEFRQALEEAAKAVGHEASTLRSQYLVPGLEDAFLKDGTVETKLNKKGSEVELYSQWSARTNGHGQWECPSCGEAGRCRCPHPDLGVSQVICWECEQKMGLYQKSASARDPVTVPYLKAIIKTILADPTGWGQSSPTVAELTKKIRRMVDPIMGEEPMTVTELLKWLEWKSVPAEELEIIRNTKVPRAPRQRKQIDMPTNGSALLAFERATGKSWQTRGALELDATDVSTDIAVWTRAIGGLKGIPAKLWKSEVKKVRFSVGGRGSEDASWDHSGVMVLVVGKGSNLSIPVLRSFITHELGHAFDEKTRGSEAYFKVYGIKPYISAYAGTNASEDFAECFRAFVEEPHVLKSKTPEKYIDMAHRLGKRASKSAGSGGDCYQAAGSYFMNNALLGGNKNLRLVHGEVAGRGPLEGTTFGHAWVEDGNTVIDKSNGGNVRIPKAVYYAMGRIEEQGNVIKYTAKQFQKKIAKHKHWGPWDLQTSTGL